MYEALFFSKYATFFHDGTLIKAVQQDQSIDLWLESAELQAEWNFDNIKLSKSNRLIGVLHLNEIYRIFENGDLIKYFPYQFENNDISSLRILDNKVQLMISWINLHNEKWNYSDLYSYEFFVDNVLWENIPDLLI